MKHSYFGSLLVLAVCFLIFFRPIGDPDFWWHLRLGYDMLQTGPIRTDTLSWTMAGRPFVDFYWLSQILFASLYEATGPLGLAALFALIASAAFWLRTIGRPIGLGTLLVCTIVSIALSAAFDVRPVVLSWLFFAVALWFFEKLDRYSYTILTPISVAFYALWANLHHGFVFSFVYFGLLMLLAWWKDPRRLSEQIKKRLTFTIAGGLATLLTPYGFSYWLTIIHEALSTQNRVHIIEWQPFVFSGTLGVIFFVLTFVVVAFGSQEKRIPKDELLLLLILAIFSATAMVHVPFFLLLLIPYADRFLTFKRLPNAVQIVGIGLCVIAAAFWSYGIWSPYQKMKQSALLPLPKEAVSAAYKLHLPGRMFNEYDWGGYLSYVQPDTKVFIDGRMSSWHKDDHSLIDDYDAIAELQPSVQHLIDYYHIDWFFIRKSLPLAQWLSMNPNYQVVYADNLATIIVRKARQ